MVLSRIVNAKNPTASDAQRYPVRNGLRATDMAPSARQTIASA